MNRGTLIGTLSFAALGVILVIGTSITGVSVEQTPSITTVLGFIGLGISQFINVKNSNDSKQSTDQLSEDLKNGTMEKLVREAIVKIAEDQTSSLHIVNNDAPKE